jgi:hypothetical protein
MEFLKEQNEVKSSNINPKVKEIKLNQVEEPEDDPNNPHNYKEN